MHAKHPPTYKDTLREGEVKAGVYVCVYACICVRCSNLIRVIECVCVCLCNISVCAVSFLQVTHGVYKINNSSFSWEVFKNQASEFI